MPRFDTYNILKRYVRYPDNRSIGRLYEILRIRTQDALLHDIMICSGKVYDTDKLFDMYLGHSEYQASDAENRGTYNLIDKIFKSTDTSEDAVAERKDIYMSICKQLGYNVDGSDPTAAPASRMPDEH